MFQHMFAAMNEMLDHIIEAYPEAVGAQKEQYEEQIHMLKKMSDCLVEQWIDFEEKFAGFMEMESSDQNHVGQEIISSVPFNLLYNTSAASGQMQATETETKTEDSSVEEQHQYDAELNMEVSYEMAELIARGQGYYKLFMFSNASEQFQTVVGSLPECNLARLFLAMTYMHLQNWSEAQREFQLLVALTDYPKWRALGYNALGCIQAVYLNLDQAEQFFLKAHEVCPSFKDPLNNLKCCKETPQQLSLFFGSTELCCL